MFDFEKPEIGSHARFQERLVIFKKKEIPLQIHYIWWVTHNCVAHPLIGLLPWFEWTFDFHDYTSRKINAEV